MRIDDPAKLKAFLRKHRIDANHGLGQHFLCSPKVVDKIIAATDGCASAIEIGPGPGILTAPLTDSVGQVVAIELDDRMLPLLSESAPTCRVVQGDALKIDLPDLIATLHAPVALVSNMPYYISAPLLQLAASLGTSIDRAVLMMQREVATRIMAKPGNRERGSLSVYLQAKFDMSLVADVPPGAFLPPPKVDSKVLLFVPKPDVYDPALFDFVRGGFGQPRKTLANNLAQFGREAVTEAISAIGATATVRPHELTFPDWQSLFAKLRA